MHSEHLEPAPTPTQADPFNGTWKLNVAASKLPFTPPRSVVLHVEADQDCRVPPIECEAAASKDRPSERKARR